MSPELRKVLDGMRAAVAPLPPPPADDKKQGLPQVVKDLLPGLSRHLTRCATLSVGIMPHVCFLLRSDGFAVAWPGVDSAPVITRHFARLLTWPNGLVKHTVLQHALPWILFCSNARGRAEAYDRNLPEGSIPGSARFHELLAL
jgi:hypothetical protein